jgi:transcriptional regulator with PAS, ATPase and Fis domain
MASRSKQHVRLIGRSQPMAALQGEIDRVARSDAQVLISGESGVGKEIVARTIHYNGPRANMAFAPVNCAGLPETLLESELFGHVKGSFTGAYRDKPGKLESAHMGTVFLDEIGEMTLRMQGLLLRFLETGEVQRVGADGGARHVNVRVIGATHRNLRDMIAQGTFREDLYYRLNVVTITLPPLRQRPDDIPILVDHFLKDISAQRHTAARRVSPEVMRRLQSYRWPGNVREVRHMLESMMVLADGDVLTENDLPDQIRAGSQSGGSPKDLPTNMTMDQLEKLAITKALEQCGNNRTHAANRLGISVRTLQRKLRQYDLEKTLTDNASDVLTEA